MGDNFHIKENFTLLPQLSTHTHKHIFLDFDYKPPFFAKIVIFAANNFDGNLTLSQKTRKNKTICVIILQPLCSKFALNIYVNNLYTLHIYKKW